MPQGQLGPQQGGGGPGGAWGGNYGGPWNGGNWDPRLYPNGPIRPEDFQNTYRDTLQSLRQLEQQTGNDPNMVRDLQALIRDMQRLNPFTYANDPLLAERIQAALLSGVVQVEMELRRKVAGFAASMADWFFAGVLFHDKYLAHPEIWRRPVGGAGEGQAIAWSILLGFVTCAAFVFTCSAFQVRGYAAAIQLAAAVWLIAPLKILGAPPRSAGAF